MKKILSLLLAGLAAASMASVVSAEEPVAGVDYIECAGGLKVWEWVEGYANETPDMLFDYDETTKWCHGSSWSYVIWEMPEAVEITAYQMVTANDNATYTGRNPNAWVLYGCNDYDYVSMDGSWEVIHEVSDDEILQDTNYTPYTIPLDAKAPSYKYYQLEISEIVGGATFQLSGFNLIFDGQEAQTVKTEAEILAEQEAAAAAALAEQGYTGAVTLNKVEGITLVSSTEGAPEAEGAVNLFDYDSATKMYIGVSPVEVVWEMPSAVAITGYQFVTGNDTESYPGRSPKSWVISGSNDGSNWTAIDTQTDNMTILAANLLPFDFMLAETAPEYKFYKAEFTAQSDDGTAFQLSGINLIYDGAVVEEVVEEAPVVEEVVETPVVEEVVEEPVVEEVVETPAVEEVVEEVVEAPVVEEAAQTFDAAIIAGIAAVVSLAGYAISKKR